MQSGPCSKYLRLFTAHGMLMVMKRWWPENSLPISEYQTKECWISIYSKLVTNKHTVLPVSCSEDRFLIIKKSGKMVPFAALWINLLSKLWRSFRSLVTIQIREVAGCWLLVFKPSWRQATRVNEMDCRERRCVRKKKKNRRWRSIFELKPPKVPFFFCHAFLTPPFEARKKHLRWTFRAQWTTFTSNIRMKRTCFIYIWMRISEHKRTNW